MKGFCSVAIIQDIEKQDYILTSGRYVGIEEQENDGEPFEEKIAGLLELLDREITVNNKINENL